MNKGQRENLEGEAMFQEVRPWHWVGRVPRHLYWELRTLGTQHQRRSRQVS